MLAPALLSSTSTNLSQTSLTPIGIHSDVKTTSAPGISMPLPTLTPMYGVFVVQFKLILVTASNTLGTAMSMKSLFQLKSSPSSELNRILLPRPFKITSKKSMVSKSRITKHGGPRNAQSKSSTVRMKKLTALSPSTAKKSNVQTPGVLFSLILTQRQIDSNVCSSALLPVQWVLLIVAQYSVWTEHI